MRQHSTSSTRPATTEEALNSDRFRFDDRLSVFSSYEARCLAGGEAPAEPPVPASWAASHPEAEDSTARTTPAQ